MITGGEGNGTMYYLKSVPGCPSLPLNGPGGPLYHPGAVGAISKGESLKYHFKLSNAYLASFQNSSKAMIRGLKKEISAGQSFLLKILAPY